MICWKCKAEFSLEKVFRSSECPKCHCDLHVCKGCKFYAPGNHFECRETITEPIADKEKSNFCDYFMIAESFAAESNADKARSAAYSLFGEPVSDSVKDASGAKNAFNSLFGD